MTQESEFNGNDGYGYRFDKAITKSRAIRDVLRKLDQFYASGPAPTLSEPSQAINEDTDVSDNSSVGPSADSSTVQHGLESETDPGRESVARTVGEGEETDEESSGHQDNSPVKTGGPDEQPSPTERVLKESEERSVQYGRSDFHFAPHFHSRGTQ